jgi:hypothetical protein
MSILIKGMEKPKNCFDCEIFGLCSLKDRLEHIKDRNPDCPLIEIPTPHGRLIEEHYHGELKAKHAEGVFIMYRPADEDTNRFILEEEKYNDTQIPDK